MYILYERKHPYELMTIYKIIFTTFEKHSAMNYLYKPKLYVLTFFF